MACKKRPSGKNPRFPNSRTGISNSQLNAMFSVRVPYLEKKFKCKSSSRNVMQIENDNKRKLKLGKFSNRLAYTRAIQFGFNTHTLTQKNIQNKISSGEGVERRGGG
jgi:hypothetical protein